ncbi:DUF3060 domain-containing protein [Arthrobacter sp. SX1312]|uniref:DUF3060 domain-containing protein n=1 Tax=Arthrobacter sp. SX1312 TaxID=2058896 RepID=UPI0015E1EFB3|nr:DUF3060 domain-containing protein [Arthrobacter sp. SX1312]
MECSSGGDIDVESNNVEVTVTGDCEDIEIDGDNNTISGGSADMIDIEGNSNTAEADAVEEISVDGDGNTVEVGETRAIDVEGNDNTVTYRTGDPVVETEGSNSVSAS